jgi:hypothetical protein
MMNMKLERVTSGTDPKTKAPSTPQDSGLRLGALSEMRCGMNRDLVDTKNTKQLVPSDLRRIDLMSGRAKRIHDLISQRAYAIYEARGRIDGHNKDDWRQAQSEVLAFLGAGPPWQRIISKTRDVLDV